MLTTFTGSPEIQGGHTCCLFDSPFQAVAVGDNLVVGYSSNSKSYVYSMGANISVFPPAGPLFTGLEGDPSVDSYSHCGKWINAVWGDPANASLVYTFFHQEWHCNYTDGGYTNKSVGYAISVDGGLTFVASEDQVIAGANFSVTHQTGEGDHSVAVVGDYLFLYFVCWDATPSGDTTISVARSPISSRGVPGSWKKLYGGIFSQPGVGGSSDAIHGLPGTCVSPIVGLGALLSVGVFASPGPMLASWSLDGLSWSPSSAGPIFTAGPSSWNRNDNSSELFGYAGLTGLNGGSSAGIQSPPYSSPMGPTAYIYFTYLAPKTDFTQRWLVQRPLTLLLANSTARLGLPPPALAVLSLWSQSLPTSSSPQTGSALQYWPTVGPVVTSSNYSFAAPVAALLTASGGGGGGGGGDSYSTVEVVDCALSTAPSSPPTMVLTLRSECGASPFSAGAILRSSGWLVATAGEAASLGWDSVLQPGPSQSFINVGTSPGALWRCAGGGGGAMYNYSVALLPLSSPAGDGGAPPSCTSSLGPGWTNDFLLGYAFEPQLLAVA